MDKGTKFGYKTYIKTPFYHVVTQKDISSKSNFWIERNEYDKGDSLTTSRVKVPAIQHYSMRASIIDTTGAPNPKRFEPFERNPKNLSTTKNQMVLPFQKYTGRDLSKTLLPIRPFQTDYENSTT